LLKFSLRDWEPIWGEVYAIEASCVLQERFVPSGPYILHNRLNSGQNPFDVQERTTFEGLHILSGHLGQAIDLHLHLLNVESAALR
jgi:hypothetical protein